MIFHGASRKLAKIRGQKSKMNCIGKGNKMKEKLQAFEGASSTCNFRKWPNRLVVGAFYKSLSGNSIISGVQTARAILETNAQRVWKKLPLKKRGKIFFLDFLLDFLGMS